MRVSQAALWSLVLANGHFSAGQYASISQNFATQIADPIYAGGLTFVAEKMSTRQPRLLVSARKRQCTSPWFLLLLCRIFDVMLKALKGTETSNYELEFRTKTNQIRYLLVNA
jgi:hypothetical protein